MYNQIWSPLKQEFVETLSDEGKKALKLYVNSFMTGGTLETVKPTEQESEDGNTVNNNGAEGTDAPIQVVTNSVVTDEKIEEDGNTGTEGQNKNDDDTPVSTLAAAGENNPETSQNAEGNSELTKVGEKAASTPETKGEAVIPKGDVTPELSEEQRTIIAYKATKTAKAAKEFSNNLTKEGAQAFSGSVDNLKKAVNPEVTE
jgi:hypothetical protein